jgi:hypothetical protein
MACTCVGVQNKYESILGRNMDWIPFAEAQNSIVIEYPQKKFKMLSAPGMIGCVTGWTTKMVIAMNVMPNPSGFHNPNGLPSVFFNRSFLEDFNYASVSQVKQIIAQKQLQPRTPFHFTCADEFEICSYAFFQGSDMSHLTQENQSLTFVVNKNGFGDGSFISNHRLHKLHNQTSNLMSESNTEKKVINALGDCQSFETVQACSFDLKAKEVKIAIGNGWASEKLKGPNFSIFDF